MNVYGAAPVGNHADFKALFQSVEYAGFDAVISGEAAHDQPFHLGFFEDLSRGRAVKSRIGFGAGVGALAEDHGIHGKLQIFMELGSGLISHAVGRPRSAVFGEAAVIGGMPIAACQHGTSVLGRLLNEFVANGNHFISVGHRESASAAKVTLNVNEKNRRFFHTQPP